MKLNAAKIKECAVWVEAHGLHPQACGASIATFCKAMGIDPRTWNRWSKLPDVSDAIERARDLYAATIIQDVENALVKAALGLDAEVVKETGMAKPETIKEYDPVTGKLIRETTTQKVVTVKAVRERRYYPPDVKAAQFVLTNMAAGKWRQKQDLNIGAQPGTGLQITVGSQAVADALRDAVATGAKPAEPDPQETTET